MEHSIVNQLKFLTMEETKKELKTAYDALMRVSTFGKGRRLMVKSHRTATEVYELIQELEHSGPL